MGNATTFKLVYATPELAYQGIGRMRHVFAFTP